MTAAQAPIRLGMVGGGHGAFIGAVHRIAARLDGRFQLVAGALSSDLERALASAAELGLAPDRSYPTFAMMAEAERGRSDGIEAVSIVTPNHMHYAPAKMFLESGVHVICDKPVTATLEEARDLAAIVRRTGKLFILTHTYTGYPMIRQARAMVADGAIGALRLVQVEYAQDWLVETIEESGSKQAQWRTDPARAGRGGALGDIGTHAYNLAAFITGAEPHSVLADLASLAPGRRLDDNAGVLLRYGDGARGMLWCSQVAIGEENELLIRIYGDRGALEWRHRQPDELWYTPHKGARRRLTRGGAEAHPEAARLGRTPAGHPEGFLEAFANLYREAADAIVAERSKAPMDPQIVFPSAEDGVRGLAFIEACLSSHSAGGAWIALEAI